MAKMNSSIFTFDVTKDLDSNNYCAICKNCPFYFKWYSEVTNCSLGVEVEGGEDPIEDCPFNKYDEIIVRRIKNAQESK